MARTFFEELHHPVAGRTALPGPPLPSRGRARSLVRRTAAPDRTTQRRRAARRARPLGGRAAPRCASTRSSGPGPWACSPALHYSAAHERISRGPSRRPLPDGRRTRQDPEFARATKSSNPDYLEGEHPLSPVTFLSVVGLLAGRVELPLGRRRRPQNYERILHGEQEFVFFGEPPRAGAVLTGVSRIDRVYEKAGRRGGAMQFTETVTEFRDEPGLLVAESRTTVDRDGPGADRRGVMSGRRTSSRSARTHALWSTSR